MKRIVAVLAVWLVTGAVLVAIPGLTPQADALPSPGQVIDVSSTSSRALAGGTGSVSFTAVNGAGQDDLYNATAVAVLPMGVLYKSGSTRADGPVPLGDPTVTLVQWCTDSDSGLVISCIVDPDDEDAPVPVQHRSQVLIWKNIADLPAGGRITVDFDVELDVCTGSGCEDQEELWPAGSSFNVEFGIYANSDERHVPDVRPGYLVDGSGASVSVTKSDASGIADQLVPVVALELSKSAEVEEGEVYRGNNDNSFTYSLHVRTADISGSDGVIVEDYLPASLRFVDCTADCVPEVVEIDGQVFTKLVWDIGSLAAGESANLRYTVYIDTTELVLPGSPDQGDPTRPEGYGNMVANTATVRGSYLGETTGTTTSEQLISAQASVEVLDLGVVKSVNRAHFKHSSMAEYTLNIRTGQYTTSSAITVVDTIPNGLCPVVGENVSIVNQNGDPVALPPGCENPSADPGVFAATGLTSSPSPASPAVAVVMERVTVLPDGTFEVLFSVDALAADQNLRITYAAFMRDDYRDSMLPVVAGDVFTNNVRIFGTTTPIASNTVDSGDVEVENGSAVSISTEGMTLDKRVWFNDGRTPIEDVTTCDEVSSTDYRNTNQNQGDMPSYVLGDLVCFRVSVAIPQGVSVRNLVVSDFLPDEMEFVEWGLTAASYSHVVLLDNDDPSDESLRWSVGQAVGSSGTSTFVPAGATVEINLLARIAEVPLTASTLPPGADADAILPDITGNLAKATYRYGSGTNARVVGLRDQVDFELAPAPLLGIDKGISTEEAVEGDELIYAIVVEHRGSPGNGRTTPVSEVVVQDILPAGFICDDVSGLSNAYGAGTCAVNSAGFSEITWVLDFSDLPLSASTSNNTRSFTYRLTVPTPLSIDSVHANLAAITQYTAASTDADPTSVVPSFYPQLPTGISDNAPTGTIRELDPVSDSTSFRLPGAVVDKVVYETSEEGPVSSSSTTPLVTIGEWIDYQYSVTIPAHTSVFSAVLSDTLPAELRFVEGPYTFVQGPVGVSLPSTTATTCVADDDAFVLCADGRLLFPEVWTNSTDDPAEFVVNVRAEVTDIAANVHDATRTNTATFTSRDTAEATTTVTRHTDPAVVQLREPSIGIAKVGVISGGTPGAHGGQTVTYTLTASNAAGRPKLYEPVVVDCLPTDLYNAASFTSLPTATNIAPGTGLTGVGNGCAIGSTRIEWVLDDEITSAKDEEITYSVVVPTNVGAGREFLNTARLTGYSLPDNHDERREYTVTQSETIVVDTATIDKSLFATTARVVSEVPYPVPGDTLTWQVDVLVPANVTLYNAVFSDSVPSAFTNVTGVTVACADRTDPSNPVTVACAHSAPTLTGNTVGVTFAELVTGTSPLTVTFRYTATVRTDQGAPPSSTNTASFAWKESDSVGAKDHSISDSSTVTLRNPAVTHPKTVSVGTAPVAPGQTFKYTITATAAIAPAYNVVIVDTLPAGIVVVPGTISHGGVLNTSSSPNTITWTLAELNPGANQPLTFDARLAASETIGTTTINNTVRATTWNSQSTASGRQGRDYGPSANVTRGVNPSFPLVDTVKTRVDTGPVYIGDEVSFTVRLTNRAPTSSPLHRASTAQSLGMTDTLPVGWEYVAGSAQLSIRGATATALDDPSITGQTLTWSQLGGSGLALAPGQNVVVTYRAKPLSTIATSALGAAYNHTNTARAVGVHDLSGATQNLAGPNSYIGNQGEASAAIHLADLSIAKTASDNFVAGTLGTFTLAISNAGPDTAVDVVVTDTISLPDGVCYSSAAGTGWVVSVVEPAPGTPVDLCGSEVTIRATRASLLPTAGTPSAITVRVSVAANVPAGTEIYNEATVAARTEDRNLTNNEAEATATVRTEADLRVVKTVSTASPAAGQTLSWGITATNLGPSVSWNDTDDSTAQKAISVSDTIPANISQVARPAVPANWTVLLNGVTWDDGVLAATGDVVTWEFAGEYLTFSAPVAFSLSGMVNPNLAATANPRVGVAISNTATVAASLTTDPTPTNNSSTIPASPSTATTLEVSKTRVVWNEDESRWDDADAEAPIIPGRTVSYRLSVTNSGTAVAHNVVLTDQTPAVLSYAAHDGLGNTWANSVISGNNVRFTLGDTPAAGTPAIPGLVAGDLVPGETRELIATFNVVSSLGAASFTNTVVASATNTNSPTASSVSDSTRVYDLSVVKTANRTTAHAGQQIQYTIEVTNNGPSDAPGNITIRDSLPASMRLIGTPTVTINGVSDPTPGFTQAVSSNVQTLTWVPVSTTETLPAGQKIIITFTAAIDAAAAAAEDVENTATVAIDGGDSDSSNNSSSVDVDITTQADVTIVKSHSGTVVAGENTTFTVTVTNAGPSARHVTISDPLPSGLSYVSLGSTTGWDCDTTTAADDNNVVCDTVTVLAPNTSRSLTITAKVDASLLAGTELTNTATVAWSDSRGTHSADGPDDLTVTTASSLELEKNLVGTGPIKAGSQVTFAIDVSNAGPSWTSADVVVTDTLPVGMTYSSHTSGSGTGSWQCTAGVANASGQIVTCVLQAGSPLVNTRLASAATGSVDAPTLNIVAQVSADVTALTLTNSAVVTATNNTSDLDDRSDTETINIVNEADLSIVKTVSGTVIAGDTGTNRPTYTLLVTNHGPSAAHGPITIEDVLPTGFSFPTGTGTILINGVASDGDDAINVTRSGQIVEWSITPEVGYLAVGGTISITFVANVDATHAATLDVRNEASVDGSNDPNPDNDESYADVDVHTRSVVTIDKQAASSTVTAGTSTSYTLSVTNDGPSAANLRVQDDLPEGLTLTGVSGTGWTCTPVATANNDVDCARAAHPVGTSTITVTVAVDPAIIADTEIDNTATVTWWDSRIPTGTTHHEDSDETITIDTESALTVTKTIHEDLATVSAGENTKFDLSVRNTGPSSASTAVVLTDTLPAHLRFVDYTTASGTDGSRWSCVAGVATEGQPQTVTCTLVNGSSAQVRLAYNATSPVLTLEVAVDSRATQSQTNSAYAKAGNSEQSATATATVDLDNVADLGVVKASQTTGDVIAGLPYQWRVTVTNYGPAVSAASASSPITISDTLPEGVAFDPDVDPGSGVTCVAGATTPAGLETVDCEYPQSLAVNGTVSFVIGTNLAPELLGAIENRVDIAPGLTAQPTANTRADFATREVTVVDRATLHITKTAPSAGITAGTNATWTVTVENQGPSVSRADDIDPINVTDLLPVGSEYVSFTGVDSTASNWVCDEDEYSADSSQQVLCAYQADLALDEVVSFEITAFVSSATQGTVTNNVSVAPGKTPRHNTPRYPGNPARSLHSASSPVAEVADLSISKVITEEIVAGARGTYRIGLHNAGPSDASQVQVVDSLPAGLSYVELGNTSVNSPPWDCDVSPTDAQELTCVVDTTRGSIASGQTVWFEIVVAADQSMQDDITNRVVVSSATPDPDSLNNEATATGTLVEIVDLSVVKSAVGTPQVDGEFTYELLVTNAGPSLARLVSVSDLVPASLTVESVSGTDWVCGAPAVDETGTQIDCTLPTLEAGESSLVEIVVSVTPDAYPQVENTVRVTSVSPELAETLDDNVSTIITPIPPSPRFEIDKVLTTSLEAGKQATYVISVTNVGLTEEPGNVVITDQLPVQLQAAKASVAGGAGTCTISGSTVTCTIPGLAVGEAVEVTITVKVSDSAKGTVVNTASVHSVSAPTPVSAAAQATAIAKPLSSTGLDAWGLWFAIAAAAALILLGTGGIRAARRSF